MPSIIQTENINPGRLPMARTLKLRQMFSNMPPRSHWPSRLVPYDPAKSEVIKWLMAHPEAGQILFNLARGARAIVYDEATAKWRGARRVVRQDH